MVMVIAVPEIMDISSFLEFVKPYNQKLQSCYFIGDSNPSRYIVLLLFKDIKYSEQFYVEYNGKIFSHSMPEVCYTGFVEELIFANTSVSISNNSPNKSGASRSKSSDDDDDDDDEGVREESDFETIKKVYSKKRYFELPNCPNCLERVDASVSGILTVVCQHLFHCACVTRWRENNNCRSCRIISSLSPPQLNTRSEKSDTPVPNVDIMCNSCNIKENLWICLVCAFIGCSRYKNKHSEEHFMVSNHTYALEVDTQRIWDYIRDSYVHRLVTNQYDGKIVQIPDFDWETEYANTIRKDITTKGKKENELEWYYLLEAHLETQKRFFEERISHLEKQNQEKIIRLEQEFTKLNEEKIETMKKIEAIESQKVDLESKTKDLEHKMENVKKETSKLQKINSSMESTQHNFKTKVEVTEQEIIESDTMKDEKIRELEEQIRDLKFFIDAQMKLTSQQNIQDGQIVFVSPKRSNVQIKSTENSNKDTQNAEISSDSEDSKKNTSSSSEKINTNETKSNRKKKNKKKKKK
eukprot:TRINITY_DN3119_c0_g3_i1.p1 TRINITY_DN3119_c0_g3~~TRINITY_DN3119_c0_g3_i1.p1  ORF type:complete len:525 (+),score=122.74 TRINITY_DN3119_c0_g3_i1:922-2496(+)